MNINPISPVTFVADQPGQSVTRQITVSGVSQVAPTDVELTVSVSAAGNDPVGTPVLVTLDPQDATPTGSVSVPAGSGIEATVGPFTASVVGADTFYNANLTITTV